VIVTQEKKKKYLEVCLEQWCHVTPFVCFTNRLLGREASTCAKLLAANSKTGYKMATYPLASVWVCDGLAQHHHCPCKASLPVQEPHSNPPNQHQMPPMGEDGAGLALFEC
jgi:hypothetical protein